MTTDMEMTHSYGSLFPSGPDGANFYHKDTTTFAHTLTHDSKIVTKYKITPNFTNVFFERFMRAVHQTVCEC